jgi:glycosyltransferase involved in cell wall biosynthesis
MAAIEAWNHRLRRVANKVDLFISPSRFLAERFAEAGFDSSKFTVLPHFVELPPDNLAERGDYALYAGRLSQEKGVDVLIAAWKKMPAGAILKIAGSGPVDRELKSMADGAENIEFLGFVEPSELSGIRRRARFTVAPSICWDNFPISVQESLADGVPVLGSRIGGIPEMVISGETGELFEPGDVEDLHEKALSLWKNDEGRRRMGILARRFAHKNFDPGNYCEILEEIYKKIGRRIV